MKTIVALLALVISTDPVVVPGPVCAVEDGNAATPADELVIGEEGYFEASCAPQALSGDMLFDFNSDKLKPTALPAIEAWAKTIASGAARLYYIDGHTDAIGSQRYNFGLSVRRAGAVRAELIRLGIPAERIVARGFGKSKPVADNRTDEGRAKNRRVEIVPAEK